MSFAVATIGSYSMFVWMDAVALKGKVQGVSTGDKRGGGDRGLLISKGGNVVLPGTPFAVSVRASANDFVAHEEVDAEGIEYGDYKVDKDVLEAAPP